MALWTLLVQGLPGGCTGVPAGLPLTRPGREEVAPLRRGQNHKPTCGLPKARAPGTPRHQAAAVLLDLEDLTKLSSWC